jgi:hypothetical protein
MRLPPVGWAFFALILVLVAWYFLTKGILIGSDVQTITRPYGEAYIHKCRYLYLSGIREVIDPQVVIETHEIADQQFCPPTPRQRE